MDLQGYGEGTHRFGVVRVIADEYVGARRLIHAHLFSF